MSAAMLRASSLCLLGLVGQNQMMHVLASIESANLRLMGAGGVIGLNVGALQVRTQEGSFGNVCGMNLAAADVVCRQLGFESGTVALTPCGTYGAADLCGAEGTAVSMQDLRCLGGELAIAECTWSQPGGGCLTHESDSIVYCSRGAARAGPREGAVRLMAEDGAPSLSGAGRPEIFFSEQWSSVCGLSPGAAAVLCRAMGFSGVMPSGASAAVVVPPPRSASVPSLGDLSCSGSEASILDCSFESGEDVYCAASEAASLQCAGEGDTMGGLWS